MGKLYMSSKVVRSEGMEYNMCGKKILETIYGNFFTLVLFTFCTRYILRCLVFIVVSCLVCIVVVVLCVLL